MRKVAGYGLDFGTSNSSIAIAYTDGAVEVVPVGAGLMPHSRPSMSYLHRNGNRLAGEEAVAEFLVTGSLRTTCGRCDLVFHDREGAYSDCRQYRFGGRCNDARLMYGLKTELANEGFTSTHSWATDFSLSDLVGVILRDLKRSADRIAGIDGKRVVLGVPVVFVGAEGDSFDERQTLAENRLIEAAEVAGFDDVEVLEEPAAAVVGRELQPGITVALDFGGGTFDVAVIEISGRKGDAEVIGLQGAAVGGLLFDGLLFDHLVADQIGATHPRLPASVRRELRTLMGIRTLLSDPSLREHLAAVRLAGGDGSILEELIYGGHAYDFYRAIENAKFELSSSEQAQINFSRPGIRVSAQIDRAEFESWLDPHLFAVDRAIEDALDEAEIVATEVGHVVLTGGSCQIPAFRRQVAGKFDRATLTDLPVYTAVAEGLGEYALRRWVR